MLVWSKQLGLPKKRPRLELLKSCAQRRPNRSWPNCRVTCRCWRSASQMNVFKLRTQPRTSSISEIDRCVSTSNLMLDEKNAFLFPALMLFTWWAYAIWHCRVCMSGKGKSMSRNIRLSAFPWWNMLTGTRMWWFPEVQGAVPWHFWEAVLWRGYGYILWFCCIDSPFPFRFDSWFPLPFWFCTCVDKHVLQSGIWLPRWMPLCGLQTAIIWTRPSATWLLCLPWAALILGSCSIPWSKAKPTRRRSSSTGTLWICYSWKRAWLLTTWCRSPMTNQTAQPETPAACPSLQCWCSTQTLMRAISWRVVLSRKVGLALFRWSAWLTWLVLMKPEGQLRVQELNRC